jgi:hypothetical protein
LEREKSKIERERESKKKKKSLCSKKKNTLYAFIRGKMDTFDMMSKVRMFTKQISVAILGEFNLKRHISYALKRNTLKIDSLLSIY